MQRLILRRTATAETELLIKCVDDQVLVSLRVHRRRDPAEDLPHVSTIAIPIDKAGDVAVAIATEISAAGWGAQ